MTKTGIIKGFKVFNPDWTCRDKQYTCPGVFEEDSLPSTYHPGMEFCKQAVDCFWCDNFNLKNKVAEVVAYTDRTLETKRYCFTKHLEIVREISWAELFKIVNTGEYCTGIYNSGDRNSGNYNSGNCNSGNYNSGNCNSGNYNSGNYNSGDWNKCSFSNGCFNTVEPKIYLFNKPSEWTYRDWLFSEACSILNRIPKNVLEYERFKYMTDEEKSVIKAIPNFDKEIFKEITGIDIDMELE